MKKLLGLLLALAIVSLFFMGKKRDEQETVREASPSETIATVNPPPQPEQEASSRDQADDPRNWLDLALDHQLSPQSIQTWTQQQGITLNQVTKGHPKSGQRRELTWGTNPITTAVFDILGDQKYQLSAVRSLYPAETQWDDLKSMLQSKVKRPIEREDEKSLVFREDEQGLVVWLARQEDGQIKLALEYGAHSHGSP